MTLARGKQLLDRFGHVAYVDPVLGDNAHAAINGRPFLTIAAALAAAGAVASASTPASVMVLPGIYYEDVVVPPFVTLQGTSSGGMSIMSDVVLSSGPNPVIAGQIVRSVDYIVELAANACLYSIDIRRQFGTLASPHGDIAGAVKMSGEHAVVKDVNIQLQAYGNGVEAALRGILDLAGGRGNAPSVIERCTVDLKDLGGAVLMVAIAVDTFGLAPARQTYLVDCKATTSAPFGVALGTALDTSHLSGAVYVYGGFYSGAQHDIYGDSSTLMSMVSCELTGPQASAATPPTLITGGQVERLMAPGILDVATYGGTTYLPICAVPSATPIGYVVNTRRSLRSVYVYFSAATTASGQIDVWRSSDSANVFSVPFAVGAAGAFTLLTNGAISRSFDAGDTYRVVLTLAGAGGDTVQNPVVTLQWY